MRPGWLELGAGAVLGLSLALKLAVLDAPVDEDAAGAVGDLARRLAAEGYAVAVPRTDLPVVRAERAGCRLTARVLDPQGLFHDTELRKLPHGWRVAYGWGGEWSLSLPRFAPLAEYYVARQAARFGFPARYRPVIMVSSDPRCALLRSATADLRLSLRRGGSD